MTKKLEEILDINQKEETVTPLSEAPQAQPILDLQEKLEEFDKISAALPRVRGLGDISDQELDALASKAEQAYDDLMDLGMNVDARYGSKMFEVAANMLNAAITAKTNKIEKKLKMVDLQLKKYNIDKKTAQDNGTEVQGEGYILTDRNSILEKLKNLK
jgi:hypothetical protein